MKTIRKTMTFSMIILLAAIAYGQSDQISTGAESEDILGRQLAMNFPDSVTTTYAFMSALSLTRVPGGIVTISNCSDEKGYRLAQSNTSLRHALDLIVSVDHSNGWQFDGGVVNLMPIQSEPALLNLRIAKFNVKNSPTAQYALAQLLALPEVQERSVELNLSEGRTEPGLTDLKRPGFGTDEPKHGFNVRCKNVTLRGALNAIVRAQGYGVWAYTERHCGIKNEFRIDLIVR